jgi:hypothetical protein
MAFDDDETKNIINSSRHYNLPNEISYNLFTEEHVLLLLKQNIDPTVISIQKWEGILKVLVYLKEIYSPQGYFHHLQNFIGSENCALCIVSRDKFIKENGQLFSQESKCSKCSLSKIDRCVNEESIYSEIENLLYEGDSNRFNIKKEESNELLLELSNLTMKMIENLKLSQKTSA